MKLGPKQTAWIERLEKNDLPQGREQLRTKKGEFCCLGVACVVLDEPIGDVGAYYLPESAVEDLGMHDDCGTPIDPEFGLSVKDIPNCAVMNDKYRLTFPQIARVLREYSEYYFKHPK